MSMIEDIYKIEHVEQSNSTSTEKNEDSLNKSQSLISTTESKGTLTKKRKRIPENWQKNIRKTKREGGEEYVDIKGQLHPAKKVEGGWKPKCSDYFSNEERNQIMKQFYKLSDEKKLHFYSKYTIRGEPLQKRTYKEKSRKSHVYKYYLEHNNTRVQVCK